MLGQAKCNCLQKTTSSVENQLKDPHPIESHTVMVDIILADELDTNFQLVLTILAQIHKEINRNNGDESMPLTDMVTP